MVVICAPSCSSSNKTEDLSKAINTTLNNDSFESDITFAVECESKAVQNNSLGAPVKKTKKTVKKKVTTKRTRSTTSDDCKLLIKQNTIKDPENPDQEFLMDDEKVIFNYGDKLIKTNRVNGGEYKVVEVSNFADYQQQCDYVKQYAILKELANNSTCIDNIKQNGNEYIFNILKERRPIICSLIASGYDTEVLVDVFKNSEAIEHIKNSDVDVIAKVIDNHLENLNIQTIIDMPKAKFAVSYVANFSNIGKTITIPVGDIPNMQRVYTSREKIENEFTAVEDNFKKIRDNFTSLKFNYDINSEITHAKDFTKIDSSEDAVLKAAIIGTMLAKKNDDRKDIVNLQKVTRANYPDTIAERVSGISNVAEDRNIVYGYMVNDKEEVNKYTRSTSTEDIRKDKNFGISFILENMDAGNIIAVKKEERNSYYSEATFSLSAPIAITMLHAINSAVELGLNYDEASQKKQYIEVYQLASEETLNVSEAIASVEYSNNPVLGDSPISSLVLDISGYFTEKNEAPKSSSKDSNAVKFKVMTTLRDFRPLKDNEFPADEATVKNLVKNFPY